MYSRCYRNRAYFRGNKNVLWKTCNYVDCFCPRGRGDYLYKLSASVNFKYSGFNFICTVSGTTWANARVAIH